MTAQQYQYVVNEVHVRKSIELLLPAGSLIQIQAKTAVVGGQQHGMLTGFFQSVDHAIAALRTIESATAIWQNGAVVRPELFTTAPNVLLPGSAAKIDDIVLSAVVGNR